jgi:hypothetical protein
MQVGTANAASQYFNKHLVIRRPGDWQLFADERVAGFFQHHGPHRIGVYHEYFGFIY